MLTEQYQYMLPKDKLTAVLLRGTGNRTDKAEWEEKKGCFQRDKGSLVREILMFHQQKRCKDQATAQQSIKTGENPLFHYLNHKQNIDIQQQALEKGQRQHFNEYIQQAKQGKLKSVAKLLQRKQPQSYEIIDNFLKNKENVMIIEDHSIKVAKGDMKSINQSTMAISKFYKPDLSPQNRKMRKTEGKQNDKSRSKSKDRQQIPQDEPEERKPQQQYQSCIFSLSDNEASCTYNSRNDNTLSNVKPDNEVKKISINLNFPKQPIKTSLVEIEEYEQLFDCYYEQQAKVEKEEKGLMEYLKNRISKGKSKQQKTLSESSSACSFLQGKEKVTDVGINKVNNIVEQAVKNVAFNLQKQKNVEQSSDQDFSSNFFPNMQSQPSTVQKFDDKSNDKSQVLRHLQELKECSASLFNHKPPQQYLLQDLNSSHLSQHFENIQTDPCKKIEIDLQNMIASNREEGSHEQSSFHPSMNSFKMEVSMDRQIQKKSKRIQIDLSMVSSKHSQVSKEVANLSELSNYESDDESIVHKEVKPKAKIVLKAANTEKHFIQGLKNDISALKNKISSSFMSQQSQLYHTKTHNDRPIPSQPHQVYQQLKSNFSNLKRRMQCDAGLRNQ